MSARETTRASVPPPSGPLTLAPLAPDSFFLDRATTRYAELVEGDRNTRRRKRGSENRASMRRLQCFKAIQFFAGDVLFSAFRAHTDAPPAERMTLFTRISSLMAVECRGFAKFKPFCVGFSLQRRSICFANASYVSALTLMWVC